MKWQKFRPSGYVDVTQLQTLILDEADPLLGEGFAEEMKAIIDSLPNERQTLFFSATFPPGMEELSQRYQKNVERITIKEPENTKPMIQQFVYESENQKNRQLFLKFWKSIYQTVLLFFAEQKWQLSKSEKCWKT